MSQDSAASDPVDFKSTAVFRLLEKAMQEDDKGLAVTLKGIYCFKVKNEDGKDGIWILDMRDGKGKVKFNGKEKPDVTLVMKDADVVELMMGKLNPQKAFFQGKVKINGNMGLAMKLSVLQEQASKKMEELKAKL
ncbi:unnamed protein product [Nezara viridula]|uniref:SCP2 domain-containing protein n=1 Tax=Nezara viridula TaxID=85310 RepID=A0A9P0E128_NEZVI|nr:unnamed protein product [Nezara viridula]